MIFKDGMLWAVMGTPGGDYQVQVNLQVLTAMIDFGYDPQQAAEAPRWSSTQPGQETDYPHACPDALNLEARFGPKVMDDLAGRGHAIVPLGDLEGPCNVEIIRRDAGSGMLFAGSDPRRDGWALAY
jgi:gamma-glutamyltranspeptidase/glutathione hydrolase